MATAESSRVIVANTAALAVAGAAVPASAKDEGISVLPGAGMETVRLADRGFFCALLQRDMPALEELLAADFQIVDVASGSVHERASFLAAISAGAVTFQQIQTFPPERTIRLEGLTAIVTGRTAMCFANAEGELTFVNSRYTHVFRGGAGSWQLASAQGTPIHTGSPTGQATYAEGSTRNGGGS
jgi:ketosteroid isomerase-like protein